MTGFEELKWECEKIREDITQLRKGGRDVGIAQLMAMRLPAKLQLAAATGNQKELQSIEMCLQEIQSELDESAMHEDSYAILCQQRLIQVKEAIGKNNHELARLMYAQLRAYYPKLKKEEQQDMMMQMKTVESMMMQFG